MVGEPSRDKTLGDFNGQGLVLTELLLIREIYFKLSHGFHGCRFQQLGVTTARLRTNLLRDTHARFVSQICILIAEWE